MIIPIIFFLIVFIFGMTLIISQNDDEFAKLIKVFYECRNNKGTTESQKLLKKYVVHYRLGEKDIKYDYGSALIIPTFKDNVIINDVSYSVMKVIHNTDTFDITVILK